MVTASEELASPNWFSARTRALYSLFSSTPWPDTVMYSVPFPEYGNGPRVAGATPSASSDTEKLSGKHVDGLWSGLHAVYTIKNNIKKDIKSQEDLCFIL